MKQSEKVRENVVDGFGMSKKVVCLSFDEELWKNVHLMKDTGLVPYYFHKIYGYESVMVGANIDQYTYLDSYVKGLQMEFVKENTKEARYKYVVDNANEIDLLILVGAYHINLACAKAYKERNPRGKIYLQLDMNSLYGEWLFQAHPELVELGDYCDVIATSCSSTQRMMNLKLPWCVECVTNGYYDGFWGDIIPEFSEKDNLILTVGRLGTWQKATEVLLEAFAVAYENIRGWKLILIGSVDEGFESYIAEYYEKYPHLMDIVCFEGEIQDKATLVDWYMKAKIFVMPSRMEGGAPNVISEALRSGCVMAITKFDAYTDIIDDGRCGVASKIDDVEAYADVICRLCNEADLEKMSKAAYENAVSRYNYDKTIRILHRLIFGGENE